MRTEASAAWGQSDDWREAVSDLLGRLEPVAGANLGFLYVTDRLASKLEDIRRSVAEQLAVPLLTGTLGVGVCATNVELMDEPAISLLIMRLPDGAFRAINSSATSPTARAGIVHVSPTQVQRLLDDAGLADTFLLGGVTASRARDAQLRPGGAVDSGLSGVLFGEQVALYTGLTQGCIALAGPHRVTSCAGNVLLTLDQRPAIEVLLEDVGETDIGRVRDIFAGVSLANTDLDDYLVRTIVGADPGTGALAVAFEAQHGQMVRFAKRDPDSARRDMQRMVRAVKSRCPEPPAAALYFSCVARGANLWGRPGVELEIIREELGEVPLAGLFGGGEICRHQVYGHTGILCLFA